ncbi:hypothetical protein [Agitococcus lubricus]|uniref:Uncharacterized protein n=1 Tax=Agitococcus lubricus TaxID=1077255 RepID=A0A2T5IY38_9GAMM|nr:hypothetical protein [Agitococcus lubricus]PTQ88867.1 hypothetical protein C8N29_11016 [Agitococcus lubricus]
MSKFAIFALKVSGTELNQISPLELGLLMQHFSKMLGEKDLSFDIIESGSVLIKLKTPEQYWSEKNLNLQQAISTKSKGFKGIQLLVNKHQDWTVNIKTSHAANDENIYTFHAESKGFVFKQTETIRGHLTRLLVGKDKTDHISLITDNGNIIHMNCSEELSKKLSVEWKNNRLLEVTGEAKYRYINFDEIHLDSFDAHHFIVLENVSMGKWLKDFIGDGQTGWSQFENPVEQWLQERHS